MSKPSPTPPPDSLQGIVTRTIFRCLFGAAPETNQTPEQTMSRAMLLLAGRSKFPQQVLFIYVRYEAHP